MKPLFYLAFGLLLVANAHAQNEISWFAVAGGGSMQSKSEPTIAGTIGQPLAGRLQGGRHTLVAGFWSYGSSVVAQRPPSLRISVVGNQSLIAWPSWAVSYQLQTASDLAAPAWEDVVQAPAVVGSELQVTLRLQAGPAFFRLRQD